MTTLKKFKLRRISMTDNGTFGVLLEDAIPFALTLEPPWKNNEPFVSCIPANAYSGSAINSPKFGNTYQLNDVQGRTHILFHKGNYGKDTKGCILVGEQYGEDNNRNPIIISSRAGFDEFMRRANGEDIDLLISEELTDMGPDSFCECGRPKRYWHTQCWACIELNLKVGVSVKLEPKIKASDGRD